MHVICLAGNFDLYGISVGVAGHLVVLPFFGALRRNSEVPILGSLSTGVRGVMSVCSASCSTLQLANLN